MLLETLQLQDKYKNTAVPSTQPSSNKSMNVSYRHSFLQRYVALQLAEAGPGHGMALCSDSLSQAN